MTTRSYGYDRNRSSSPLPGIATGRERSLCRHVERRVLIAPTRDRNTAKKAIEGARFRRPHRPYQGSQLGRPDRVADERDPVLIAPTRDRNVYGVVTDQPGLAGPHRPYQGSQPVERAVAGEWPRVLIAPTRDRNMPM